MESILIVSGSEKGREVLREFLSVHAYQDVVYTGHAAETKRLLLDRCFDLCVINTPLPDEFGSDLAISVVEQGVSQVMCLVKSDVADTVSAKLEDYGIFVLAKPLNKQTLWSAFKLMQAAHHRLRGLQNQNDLLRQKIEDIRLVDRAKCLLISYLKMTEPQAHRYIEKQAMDLRLPKREIAIHLIRTYEE
ncbi:MAG: ANTAR domain-containing protein [Oscillospiraceae bacterium]|nr:ANTAR domain-containing protein [Oscillospiraceae bacterium]